MSAVPLRTPRLVLLGLTWALAVVGAAAGLNAIVKRNDQVATIKKAVSALKITVDVDTNNLLRSGIVLAVGCLLLAITSSIFILLLLLDTRKSATSSSAPISTRTLPIQSATLAFLTLWLFATLVAVTKFAAHGSAIVHAYSGGFELPDSLVKATEARLGFSRVYWDQLYVRILTIAPWFAFLSAIITTIVTFLASNKRTSTITQGAGWTEKEKGETEMQENARIE